MASSTFLLQCVVQSIWLWLHPSWLDAGSSKPVLQCHCSCWLSSLHTYPPSNAPLGSSLFLQCIPSCIHCRELHRPLLSSVHHVFCIWLSLGTALECCHTWIQLGYPVYSTLSLSSHWALSHKGETTASSLRLLSAEWWVRDYTTSAGREVGLSYDLDNHCLWKPFSSVWSPALLLDPAQTLWAQMLCIYRYELVSSIRYMNFTETDRYMNLNSHHHQRVLRGIIRCLRDRAHNICAGHAWNSQHPVNWDGARVRCFEQHMWRRKVLEAIVIWQTDNSSNLDCGLNLNQVWSPLLD